MSRLTSFAAFAAVMAMASPAFAQSQQELAERDNEEGKELMYANRYAEATAKFRSAVARVPEGKYFFNLCTSLFQEGKFGEALTACNAVSNTNVSPELRAKTDKLTGRIKAEAQAQGIDVEPVGGGAGPGGPVDCATTPTDPSCQQTPPPDVCAQNPQDPACQPATTPPPQPVNQAVGRPPTQGLFTSVSPDNKYTWTLGIELYGGGGKVGRENFYGSSGGGVRFKGDYLLNAKSRVGVQGYMQFTGFSAGEMDVGDPMNLDIFDIGLAAYKHVCLTGTQRLCLTPLAGLQIAMMSPNEEGDSRGSQVFNYAALGGRLELGAHYGFGRRFEHVLGIAVGFNVYSPVFSGPSDSIDPDEQIEMVGLDKGGAAAYFGLGYTYRFNTPLGSSPFVTLE